MTELSAEALVDIDALLAELGVPAAITVKVANTYLPSSGVNTPTVQTYSATVSPPEENTSFVPGDTTKSAECKVVLSANGLLFAPLVGMTVSINNTTWTCVEVVRWQLEVTLIAYELRLQR